MNPACVAVVGLGEVGKPLFELLSEHYNTVGVDIDPVERVGEVDVLHICFPSQIHDFVGETVRYIERYKPALTIINSTVPVGTTRKIAARTHSDVVNSPVRGKHARMLADLRKYTKFVGAMHEVAGQKAAEHFEGAGLRTRVLRSPEASELAKLSETTFFGLMIVWAQEVERYCDQLGTTYDDVVSFYDEIEFFPPVKYVPGVIGGHCVMQNIELLAQSSSSVLLDAIRRSNEMKIEREIQTPNEALV